MRTEMVRKTRLIRHYPGADIVFLLELTLHGKFLEIDRPLFYRRMHEQASSNMKSSLPELQAYLDPSIKGRVFLRQWRTFSDQVVTVLRGPLSLTERVQLLYFLVRGMVACRDEYLRELVAIARAMVPRPRQL